VHGLCLVLMFDSANQAEVQVKLVGLEDQCFLIYSYSNLIVEKGAKIVVLTVNF
jgi:hypothetical protein